MTTYRPRTNTSSTALPRIKVTFQFLPFFFGMNQNEPKIAIFPPTQHLRTVYFDIFFWYGERYCHCLSPFQKSSAWVVRRLTYSHRWDTTKNMYTPMPYFLLYIGQVEIVWFTTAVPRSRPMSPEHHRRPSRMESTSF